MKSAQLASIDRAVLVSASRLLAALFVASCASAPAPSVEELLIAVRTEPQRTRESAPAQVHQAPHRVDVWTIEAVLERIASASPNVALAFERVEQARAALREARASYAPEFALNVGYSRTDDPAMAFGMLLNQEQLSLGPAFDPTPGSTDNWREEVRLDWALFAPGRAQQHAAAREGERAAELQAQAIENRLLNAGVQAWLGLRAARQLEEVARSSIAAVEQRVEQTRVRAREGAALHADVLRLEVRAAAAREEAARTRLDAQRAANALAALTGAPANEFDRLGEAPPQIGAHLPNDLEGLLDAAEIGRADLAALAHRSRVESHARRAREAERLPVVGLFASYAIDGEQLEFDTDLDKYALGVGVRLPLSARTAPRIDGARSRERGAALELRALTLEIEREVRDAWAEREAARDTLALADAAAAAAEEAFRVVALAQDAGGATVTDVLEAQDALNGARVRRVAAAAGVEIASARLVAATGGVL